MNIAIVYFSGTNVTDMYAKEMKRVLEGKGWETDLLNVTAFAARQKEFLIDDHDFFIFGFPVFADFAPSVINTWIQTLAGKGKRCALFFSYGARTTGYAHFHTMNLLEGAGFRVMLSAEFLGRHSFNVAGWQILPDRPDEGDFAAVKEYVEMAIERLTAAEVNEFRLQKPFGYDRAIKALSQQKKKTTRGWTNPFRVTDECSMCRDCETECPTQAFNADSGESDPKICIECMRCVYICPDKVIKVDERMKGFYQDFIKSFNLTEEMMRAKKSKVISESWQAAS